MMRTTAFVLFLSALLSNFSVSSADSHVNCVEWAEHGECEHNPGYMMRECADACTRMAELQLEQEARASSINSFFDLEAEDIDGNLIPFEKFRGHVTVITNVASYCGFTESHYKSLVELWSQVRHEPVNILAFPCNQFGNQEPGTAEEIKAFAKSKGVEFTMMNKIDVNGANTSLIYLFLKNRAGPRDIAWNFGTYFVVSGDGDVTSHSGVDPMDLMGTIANMLGKEEL